MFRDRGIDHERRQTSSSSKQFVQIVAMVGPHLIDKNVLPVARTVNIAALLTTLQKFVENPNNLLNPNQE